MNRIFLYGIANVENEYRIVRYSYILTESVSIKRIITDACWLKIRDSAIEHVYAIDDRPGLYRDYQETIRRNHFEDNVSFKDLLERDGILII